MKVLVNPEKVWKENAVQVQRRSGEKENKPTIAQILEPTYCNLITVNLKYLLSSIRRLKINKNTTASQGQCMHKLKQIVGDAKHIAMDSR